MIFRIRTRMSKEVSNGDHNSAAKAPPTPSPLRFSKFFQVYLFDSSFFILDWRDLFFPLPIWYDP